jgi:hypothetical protein
MKKKLLSLRQVAALTTNIQLRWLASLACHYDLPAQQAEATVATQK